MEKKNVTMKDTGTAIPETIEEATTMNGTETTAKKGIGAFFSGIGSGFMKLGRTVKNGIKRHPFAASLLSGLIGGGIGIGATMLKMKMGSSVQPSVGPDSMLNSGEPDLSNSIETTFEPEVEPIELDVDLSE
ncbi:hypothetical protein [Pseudobutyrivibrio sp.]